ncbi:hypothetical protein SAMN05660742_117114 [Propionispira arboris]|uniref:Uncharacterized protein n=1 Tax=Propionispira arboris TaxID=84035 RepID=A0A1H7BS56_9FIRM|nr:hypothetical protein [Propionispira arboris]SEJ80439.1 hypothetical protein SAMN05660742_117114 [Propionispira arboris]
MPRKDGTGPNGLGGCGTSKNQPVSGSDKGLGNGCGLRHQAGKAEFGNDSGRGIGRQNGNGKNGGSI